jgi:hypothetical protein
VVLFSFVNEKGEVTHLTKDLTTQTLKDSWAKGGFNDITGHSFRVGGASFRNAMDVSPTEICFLGRWVFNCYQLYIREYSKEEIDESTALLAELNACWGLLDGQSPSRALKDKKKE